MTSLVDPDTLREVLHLPAGEYDAHLTQVIAAVDELLQARLTPHVDHARHAACREAALGMAVQVWQARQAPGGQMITADMGPTVSPHLLGDSLVKRFGGLLGLCLQVGRRPVIA